MTTSDFGVLTCLAGNMNLALRDLIYAYNLDVRRMRVWHRKLIRWVWNLDCELRPAEKRILSVGLAHEFIRVRARLSANEKKACLKCFERLGIVFKRANRRTMPYFAEVLK